MHLLVKIHGHVLLVKQPITCPDTHLFFLSHKCHVFSINILSVWSRLLKSLLFFCALINSALRFTQEHRLYKIAVFFIFNSYPAVKIHLKGDVLKKEKVKATQKQLHQAVIFTQSVF